MFFVPNSAYWFQVDLTKDVSDEKAGVTSKDEKAAASRATKMKLLMNYMSVFSSNGSMSIPWPKAFVDMMSAVKTISSVNPMSLPVVNVNCVGTPNNYYSTYYAMIVFPLLMIAHFKTVQKIGSAMFFHVQPTRRVSL